MGGNGIIALSNGNYVVQSPECNDNCGAATWGNGSTGTSGTVSAANSLVGSNPGGSGDFVGLFVIPLSNGNYVVDSSLWNNSCGAVTWGDGNTGISGTVSAANSLVGSNPGDSVGGVQNPDVLALSNGNYVVESGNWNGGRGAVTWGNGNTGISGVVSVANSLIGSNSGDGVGGFGVMTEALALSNGNYLVDDPRWNGNRGAVTWANGSTGISGAVSEANSLVGSSPGDFVGGYLLLNSCR